MKRRVSPAALLVVTLLGSGCSNIVQLPSENQNGRIQYLVMHYTVADWDRSVELLTRPPHNVSSHYLVPRGVDSQKVHQLVDESARAWHAGDSYWQGKSGLNDQSIGIEVVNESDCFGEIETNDGVRVNDQASLQRICLFPDFDSWQIEKLIALSLGILRRHPDISPTRVVGHGDIAPGRKIDPGPRFPWYELYQAGIGAWYEREAVERYWLQFREVMPSITVVQRGLAVYGYKIEESGVLDAHTVNVLTSFQMHFQPWLVDGQPSPEMVAKLFALLERYFPEQLAKLQAIPEPEIPTGGCPAVNGGC